MSKITVLWLAANPSRTEKLMLDEEMRAITEKIYASELRESLELESGWAIRPDDLLQLLNRYKPHILHFSGHGSHAGELILAANNGSPKPLDTRTIKALFTTLKDNIQVVILNACYSSTQAKAIIEVVNCAIGMNDSIGDQAAITFAASFYRALGFGRSVQGAFDQGKLALLLEGIPEENTPELLVKEGIDPSQIILVSPTNPSTGSAFLSSGLSTKQIKRERLFNAYKVILDAAGKYQFEAHQLNHIHSSVNISVTGVDEAVTEIMLEDVDSDVLPIFYELRGAFYSYDAHLNIPAEGSWPEVIKNKRLISEKYGQLTKAMNSHLKELES